MEKMRDEAIETGSGFIALLLSVGLVSPTAFPFRIAKSRQSSRSMHGGSEEPMFRYYLNAMDKADNGDLHDMQGKGRRGKEWGGQSDCPIIEEKE